MLVIIDYGVGNLGSLMNMCKYIGVAAKVSSSKEDIENASHLLLPGVGAFDYGANSLKNSGLIEVIERKVFNRSAPILGICLGMQLMTLSSAEGEESGLGWIDAQTKRIPGSKSLKVPHMGWSRVEPQKKSALFSNYDNTRDRYYFVHSYYVNCNNPADVTATISYGVTADIAFEKDNVFGVQFHPEKSHHFGMKILKNFSSI